jgi:hypothetical protein
MNHRVLPQLSISMIFIFMNINQKVFKVTIKILFVLEAKYNPPDVISGLYVYNHENLFVR